MITDTSLRCLHTACPDHASTTANSPLSRDAVIAAMRVTLAMRRTARLESHPSALQKAA